MAFSESLKVKIRQRSNMRCCICNTIGVEIHHIVPQFENGEDTEDNAAPLCPSCHETYGDNPKKRKFIRECRDNWFSICQKKFEFNNDFSSEFTKFKEEIYSMFSPLLKTEEKFLSLGDAIAFIYNFSLDKSIDAEEIDWLFSTVWKNIKSKELEFKYGFVDKFGVETLKRICAYSILTNSFSAKEGFTAENFGDVIGEIRLIMVLLLLHAEINEKENAVLWGLKNNELAFKKH